MLVRDVMSHPVVTVTTSTTVTDAERSLCSRGFTALPVVDDGNLVGIVTEADLIGDREPRARAHGRHEYPSAPEFVGDVMTTPVQSLTAGATLADAARIMVDDRIRCLPIVDGHGVVGIVTRRDLLRADLADEDQALADAITRQLAEVQTPARWRVSVEAGVADIEDYGTDASTRDRAARLASQVPGVVEVHAHHQTPDPF